MPLHSALLKYFDETRRCGSIRLAARKLYVASSAVNRQILKLEDELGVKLFERSRQGIRLTPAGRLLADHISRTLADAERTLAEIAALRNADARVLTIAGQESVIAHFLPPALVAFHAACPQVSTVFKAADGLRLQELLVAGGADLALAFDPEPAPGVRRLASRRLAVGAVLTRDHPLAARPRVTLAECAAFPIILPDQSWPLRGLLDREIARAGLSPRIITSSNSVEFLRQMVDQHLGLGFQTIVGIEGEVSRGELLHLPLDNPEPVTQEFTLCVRADRAQSPAIGRILALLERRLADYGK